jgi:hypothetical protein
MRLKPGLIFELACQAQLDIAEQGAKRRIRCPFHDDRRPSAFLSEDNVFFCSVCTSDGGWTAKRFAEQLGIPWLPQGWELPTLKRPERVKKEITFGPAEAEKVWSRALARARDDDAVVQDGRVYKYVASRGLAEAWEDPGFGILNDDMELPATLAWWPGAEYRLVVPLFDLRGELVNVQARSLDPQQEPRTLFPKGSRASGTVMANETALGILRGEGKGGGPVILGEGLTDYLALGTVTSLPVLSAPGASLLPKCAGAWANGREIYLGADVDEAGDNCLEPTAGALYRAGARRVLSITWPEGCVDACETIVTIGPHALASFLEEITGRGAS